MATRKKKKRKRKSKTKLSPEELTLRKTQRKHHRELRAFFRDIGFSRINTDGTQIEVGGRNGELDDVFVYENIIVVMEYTVGKPSTTHLLKKKPLYDKMLSNVPEFLAVARSKYEKFSKALNPVFDDCHFRIRVVYASLHDVSQELVDECSDIYFLHGGTKKYFCALGKTIERSARVEFFSFLKLEWARIGEGVLSSSKSFTHFSGQLLPENMSSFPPNYKVVSFYADPESLITGAYVLRRDGWRDSENLYQRVLVRSKIAKMRRYLIDEKRVFVNNIIVTLPSNTALNKTANVAENLHADDLNTAQGVSIGVPAGYGTVGIVDGQHRVFCYHEGSDGLEPKIKLLRKKQHLLVTGIIYPANVKPRTKQEFEARLFLEINDTQTRARPALRQDIETIVRPFSGIAVARRVIAEMAKRGPYKGVFQTSYFDAPSKIKTSSIVSYGLRPLVKFDGQDCLFAVWPNQNKDRLKAREKKSGSSPTHEADLELLSEYIKFCVESVNDFFVAAKLSHGALHWDVDDEQPNVLLRPTSINGLIACLRRVIASGAKLSSDLHRNRMVGFEKFEFGRFKSSQWDALGQVLFEKHYKIGGS